ncbi:MAG: LarC family nickel insertion protein [Eubacterium sp.]|nr:LarC family nickel insertion protein [Eubacterium sp.]
MERKLYLECSTGISGDMTVASLIDLGADLDVLQKAIDSLKEKMSGFDVKISDVEKSGIIAKDFAVILENDNHDHDMEYLYGHEHHSHEHHDHDHHASHNEDQNNHDHHHEGHGHSHVHRSLKDVIDIINIADITEDARELAIKVFTIVANAESAVHGKSIDEVHFHEVGAIDSIIDIISAAVCFDSVVKKYGIREVIVTGLVDGTGTVRCQHGILPVPVPAVIKIAEQTGVPIIISGRQGEYVTPTGAAFAAAVMTDSKLPGSMRIIKTGLGAGKRNQEVPGVLRTLLIEQ